MITTTTAAAAANSCWHVFHLWCSNVTHLLKSQPNVVCACVWQRKGKKKRTHALGKHSNRLVHSLSALSQSPQSHYVKAHSKSLLSSLSLSLCVCARALCALCQRHTVPRVMAHHLLFLSLSLSLSLSLTHTHNSLSICLSLSHTHTHTRARGHSCWGLWRNHNISLAHTTVKEI